jgi:hypothetical protein
MSDIEVIDEKRVGLRVKATVPVAQGQGQTALYGPHTYTTTVTKYISREDAKKLADDLYKACEG